MAGYSRVDDERGLQGRAGDVPLVETPGRVDSRKKPQLKPGQGKANLKRVISLAKPEKYLLLAATGALIFSTISQLALPLFMGRIIDAVSNSSETEGKKLLTSAISLLVVFFVVGALFSFARAALFTIAGTRVVCRLRKDLFGAIVMQEIGFFDESRTGELTNRLAADTEVIQNSVSVNISMMLRHIGTVVVGIIVLFFISWKLTLVMLTVVPAVAIGTVFYGKFMKKLTKAVQDALARASEVAEESFANIRTVRSFAQEPRTTDRYAERIDASFELAKKRAIGWGGFSGGIGLIAELAMAGVLWYGATLVLKGEMTVGTLTSFILYTLTVAFSVGLLSSLYGDFMKSVGASERVFELIDRIPKVNPEGGDVLDQVDGHVKLTQVEFSYPSRPDVPVLKGVDLELAPGKVVAVVGPSGGGKSTIVHLIERFYDPTLGNITLDGTDLRSLEPSWLRRQIGLVSQEPILFATSIAENIAFGRPTATQQEIEDAAKLANAHSFVSQFPEGYRTTVGEKGVRLSGGQKQRIAIARAVLMDPRILLLDEATSALDSESEHLVQEALDRLMKARTVLVVAHRLSTVKNADVVAVITGGQIAEKGTHDELIAANGIYKKLVARQLQWEPTEGSSPPALE